MPPPSCRVADHSEDRNTAHAESNYWRVWLQIVLPVFDDATSQSKLRISSQTEHQTTMSPFIATGSALLEVAEPRTERLDNSTNSMRAIDDKDDCDHEQRECINESPARLSQRNTMPHRPAPVITRIPNTAFGISMGLAGNAILWKTISEANAPFQSERVNLDVLTILLWCLALSAAIMVGLGHIYKAWLVWLSKNGDERDSFLLVQEWRHPLRIHFMYAPHLILIMLAIGIPESFEASQRSLQIIFGVALVCQTLLTQTIYDQWLFSPASCITCKKPPFLLSTVGWFLLTNLGIVASIEDTVGLAVPQFFLGIGCTFYLLVAFSIVTSLPQNRQELRGSPSLALLLAPPSVGVVALDALFSTPSYFSTAATMVLGWLIILLVMLMKIGPTILQKPKVLGEYWAYVFPSAALATAFVRYATVVHTTAAKFMAAVFISMASVALVAVICRMVYHSLQCCLRHANWGDPLLGISSSITLPAPGTQDTNPV
jgi:tellurite resistance protein